MSRSELVLMQHDLIACMALDLGKRLRFINMAITQSLCSKLVLVWLLLSMFLAPANASEQTIEPVTKQDCVILLHGLARTSASMNELQKALLEAGYTVAKIDYPSRKYPIETLAPLALKKGLEECHSHAPGNIHVVTHSMGGILFRHYVNEFGAAAFARTIMLAPPNNGSEAVDALFDVPGFQWLNGPAGRQLGTDELSVPLKLGDATSDIAIIAGTFSINLVLSTYLPDPDDGKVSVQSTRLNGMCAHLQVEVSHPYIMKDEEVIAEILSYLESGRFADSNAEHFDCPHKFSG